MPTPLLAWCCPAYTSGSPVDHTWVTTYDSRINCYSDIQSVVQAGEDLWFSWGSFHDKGGTPANASGFLGSRAADVALARCLVKSGVDSQVDAQARGTIFAYGYDGVCHQLSNQILYATGPTTVQGVRGYVASTFLYGTYGIKHAAWAARIGACSGSAPSSTGAPRGAVAVTNLPDDFETRARSVLGRDDPELLNRLLSLRPEVQVFASRSAPSSTPPDATTLNARNQHLLDQAAALLGPKKFQELFGFAPDEKINLVVPEIEQGGGRLLDR